MNFCKIYIGGKVTGNENYKSDFAHAEANLRFNGYEVINPVKIMESLPPSTKYEDYMRLSLFLLDMADAIYMLKNYEDSDGAKLELKYAKTVGKQIIFE